jgi:signal transduction histidine kinase
MSGQLTIAFFIIIYLRKSFKTKNLLPEWDRILLVIMFTCIALFVAQNSIRFLRPVIEWVSYLVVFGVFAMIYFNEIFRSARSVFLAVLPLIIVSFLEDILGLIDNNILREWHNAFGAIKAFALLWMITMLIINSRQRKAIERERLKTHEEEEQNKIMASLKAELEVQVAERTTELTRQKEELELALTELKATQAQLIQSEKLASLGELTAGIAHEIQNPLNFVNNFSEVNTELIEEMKLEIEKGNFGEVLAIANDIKENEIKIGHHGKRADGIVKGMLQHSRTSTGAKEPTNLNALADEYLRLAYHGLRAKDKLFNATMNTYFDEKIGSINMIPQDMGRVILNLITNAFYVVDEKKKSGIEGYEPTVSVSSKKIADTILISVKDNGNGIPQKILDKIFQPFFTTKPTGQGTGLGLSLSYDIVKAHGGELNVQTKEGEGSEFIIQLPV